MVAAMLFAISVVALAQFAIYYWRSAMAGVADQPLSHRVREAAGLPYPPVRPGDFRTLVNLHELTPELSEGDSGLAAVRVYYRAIQVLRRLAALGLPALATWADREMATCTRYVAVLVDRRLERTLACAAEMRSS